MLLKEAIAKIKGITRDETDTYTPKLCLDFLNHAVQEINAQLIAARYAPIVKRTVLHNRDPLPKDFMMAAGQFPMRITDGHVEIIDDDEVDIKLRYFSYPPTLTMESKELPFKNEAINEVVVQLAVLLAFNNNSYDISTDSQLQSALATAIAGGLGIGA